MDKKLSAKRVLIEELYPHRESLQKFGFKFKALCPFHDDQNAFNFFIYRATNTYYCFVCGFGGDAIDFYMRLNKVDFTNAINSLSQLKHGR